MIVPSEPLRPAVAGMRGPGADLPARAAAGVRRDSGVTPWREAAVCGLLVLAVVLVFGRTVYHRFINYDDPTYVSQNPHVTHGLTVGDMAWALTASEANNWHPLTWISHQLDWQLYRDWAGGHHLSSVLLHALNAALLAVVLRRMTGRLWPAVVVAALFALHPLRVESVAWAAERKDVLSGFFFMLTLAAYTAYCRRDPGRPAPSPSASVWGWSLSRVLWYLLVLVLYAMGLAAKPMLVTVPCVLLLLDYWPLGRFAAVRAWKLIAEKLPLLLLGVASCAVTLHVQTAPLQANRLYAPGVRLANATTAYVGYLGHFFYPLNLAPFYPFFPHRQPIWEVVGCAAILLGISALVVVWRRTRPYLVVGWLWYLGMLVPVIGLVQVGLQAMADRYTYLPQIGLAITLVWGGDDLRQRWSLRPALVGFVTTSVLAGLAAMAWLQTGYWKDTMTLWRHALACTSHNWVAHDGVAEAFSEMGCVNEALGEYRAALQILPGDDATWYNMAVALDRAGRTREALAAYATSLELQSNKPQAHFNMANALAANGQIRQAIDHYQQALKQDGDYAKAHYNLAWWLATADPDQGGDPRQAVAVAQRAARLPGGDRSLSLDVLAVAYAAAGRFPEAVAAAQNGIRAALAEGAGHRATLIEARLKFYLQGRAYHGKFAID